VDDAYWGGKHNGGKRGRDADSKMPFIAAVQTDENGHPIAMRFTELKGFRTTEIAQWAKRYLTSSGVVVSDGLACFGGVLEVGCQHQAIVTCGGPDSVKIEAFTWVNTMIGNVKNSMHGSYHAVSDKHLPHYLAEFCYRFNRRFKLEDMILCLGNAVVRHAIHASASPQRG